MTCTRHVKALPVKLIRPQNDLRKKHPDRMFARETSQAVDSLAKFFGPEACLYISQDDKAAVPIGRTAAKVQSPMLMSMQSRVIICILHLHSKKFLFLLQCLKFYQTVEGTASRP